MQRRIQFNTHKQEWVLLGYLFFFAFFLVTRKGNKVFVLLWQTKKMKQEETLLLHRPQKGN